MKKFLPFLSILFIAAACNSKPEETETRTIQSAQQATQNIDTAGLAAFQQWKAQNELTAAAPVQQQTEPVAQAPVRTVTVVREVRVQEPSAPARKTVRRQAAPRVEPRQAPVENESNNNTSAGNSDVASNTGSGSGTADAPGQQETAKKEGMSNATKGAVIGSAGGAVVGAVINKRNRGVGAVIGGVIGGAVGYGIGKKKDNKEAQQ